MHAGEAPCSMHPDAAGPSGLPRRVWRGLSVGLLSLVLLSRCAAPPPPRLSEADNAQLNRITAYLNGIPRFAAQFVQTGSFGADTGEVWLDRPAGHMRIDYASPNGRVMVISNGQVLVVDRANDSTTTLPVARTPLGMLLTPTISLSGGITVESLIRQPGLLAVTLRKTDQPSQGRLTLVLTDQPLRLAAVTVVDAANRTLTMRLSDLDVAPRLTPALFQPPALPSDS